MNLIIPQTRTAWLAAALLLAFASPPVVAGQLKILKVVPDYEGETLEITGENFNQFGPRPLRVELGSTASVGDISALCVLDLSVEPQAIICDFSSEGMPPDGDYRLLVSVGNLLSIGRDQYDLTFKATGEPSGIEVVRIEERGKFSVPEGGAVDLLVKCKGIVLGGGCSVLKIEGGPVVLENADISADDEFSCRWLNLGKKAVVDAVAHATCTRKPE